MVNSKVTKKDILSAIATLVKDDTTVEVGDVTVTAEDITEYVNVTINQLAAKTEKARERAAEKKAEGDALRVTVKSLLTNEYQSGTDIAAQIDDPEITKSKVTARLTQLIKAGECHKALAKLEDGRKVTVYAAGPAPEGEDAE